MDEYLRSGGFLGGVVMRVWVMLCSMGDRGGRDGVGDWQGHFGYSAGEVQRL